MRPFWSQKFQQAYFRSSGVTSVAVCGGAWYGWYVRGSSLKQLAFFNQRLCAWLRVATAEFGHAVRSVIVASVCGVSVVVVVDNFDHSNLNTYAFFCWGGGGHERCV